MNQSERKSAMIRAFIENFGVPPTLGVRAPGRVDLMGSHTDYNDGHVLTLPINRSIWIAARPREDDSVNLQSMNIHSAVRFSSADPGTRKIDGWGIYAQGVAVELQAAGYLPKGCDALVHGTVPVGSGLSSSAALEAACATLFETLGSFKLDPVEKARLCQRAENRWVGVNCGILDQYSSILGEQDKALLLDCRKLSHRYADVPEALQIVIGNTCAPRQLSGSEYDLRRSQCEQGAAFFTDLDPDSRALRDVSLDLFESHEPSLETSVARRCRFVIEENRRVFQLADALQTDDRDSVSRLMQDSFRGARDLFEISVPAMEHMIDAMVKAPGCVGARQAGAGFGGCMVAIVEAGEVPAFCESTARNYQSLSGIQPEIYPIRTAPGAGPLDITG